MHYTIKNLREVENIAPRFGFQEVQEARFPQRDLEAETIGKSVRRGLSCSCSDRVTRAR